MVRFALVVEFPYAGRLHKVDLRPRRFLLATDIFAARPNSNTPDSLGDFGGAQTTGVKAAAVAAGLVVVCGGSIEQLSQQQGP